MIEMLELLEDIPNVDYNAPDNEGNTPLHFAAQAGHVEVVSFLLNKVIMIIHFLIQMTDSLNLQRAVFYVYGGSRERKKHVKVSSCHQIWPLARPP